MGSINVRLPDEQKKQIEETAEKENYPSPSEWVREAIREKLKEDEELDPELLLRALKLKEGEVETKDIDEVIQKYE